MAKNICCHSKQPLQIPSNSQSGIYTCPMHPEIQQHHPGSCPICGMALEPQSIGVEDDSEYRDMLRRFFIGLILTLPILFLSVNKMFPFLKISEIVSPSQSGWLQFILCTPIVLWAGWPFFKKAWQSVIHRSLNMFSLIALGIGTAYSYSAIAVLFPDLIPDSFKENGELFIYFEAAAVITVLVLLGQVLELKARTQTGQAIKRLLNRAAKTAHLEMDHQEKEIPVEQVKVGDLLRLKPGEKIPVDGVIVDGMSYVDESMITGESIPVEKTVNSLVIGGTINKRGSFLMQAQRVGHETMLARIIQMVSDAQRSKAPIQKLADKVASYFVPIVLLVAIITFFIWAFVGPTPRLVYGLVNAIAVLIIACPCALGLATPMSIMVGVGQGAQMGVLIKNAESLQALEKINTLVIDKTGTLTEGKPTVEKVLPEASFNENQLLLLAAAVEKNSEHPLAESIVKMANEKKFSIPKAIEFESFTGLGVQAIVNGKFVKIGKQAFIQKDVKNQNLSITDDKTVLFVSIDHQFAGTIIISDPIKKTTPEAILKLHEMGIKIIMLTGDNKQIAQSIAKKLNIDQFYADVSPEEKKNLVQKLKEEGLIVAMAGDGINDSPALAISNVGIAMGTGTDVAIESAGVTLVKGDLNGILRAIQLSKATMTNIRQNLFFAFIYNIAGIPIAAGVLYPFIGLLLNPMLASAAMSLSSVSVIANSLRLRYWKQS